MITIAESDKQIASCFDVMAELRPHLNRNEFLNIIRNMEKDGYKLAYIEYEAKVVAVAGYRIATNLFMGKHLYVDDLVTSSEYRSHGYGEQLVAWLKVQALESECKVLHLDSGTHRAQAHKFYFRQGFTIASYHFSQQLNEQ